jgi:hypothetical protein
MADAINIEELKFQFQYGAGKSMVGSKSYSTSLNFNSNMVRVKDRLAGSNGFDRLKFQFQYGAGKRKDSTPLYKLGTGISIPIWCG